jgi:predicted metal-dependent enzyme (double-stranded beta helix superfamily)
MTTLPSQPANPREMVGTKLLFENDKVKIWELRLQPGERTPMHQHDLDYVVVQVHGDRVAVDPHPDTKSVYKKYQEEPVQPGFNLFVEKGGIEVALNPGKQEYLEILVEVNE